MRERHGSGGFTLVEMLTVIAIIMVVVALALPNFVAMMRGRKWTATLGNIQGMVMRARALTTTVRHDFSVEFDIHGDNGTWMWLESEQNMVERVPDLWELQHELGGSAPVRSFITSTFREAGGSYKAFLYDCQCTKCGHQWTYVTGAGSQAPCPNCGVDSWAYRPKVESYYYDITWDPANAYVHSYGDNARQGHVVPIGPNMTIDLSQSPNFISWDHPNSVECYGGDTYPDIRLGTNGALVQTHEPTICLKHTHRDDSRRFSVVRCTGRLIPER